MTAHGGERHLGRNFSATATFPWAKIFSEAIDGAAARH
jgi:hypothetical protein